MNIKSKLVAVTAVVAILGGSAVALVQSTSAQDDGGTPPAERQDKRSRFLERVASQLGINVATLQQAIKDARLEGVDEALADGRMTEEQATKARERINSGAGDPGRFKERRQQRHERKARVRGAIVENAAAAIAISEDDLKEALKAGKSIADVAADNGVALDDVKSRIISAAETKLGEAVAKGRIDQAKADEMLQKLTESLDDLLNRKRTAPATP